MLRTKIYLYLKKVLDDLKQIQNNRFIKVYLTFIKVLQ